MDIVKVNWSGGKDSTCACLLHLVRGDRVKAVCYIPMFTETIPLISKKHYDFIIHTKEILEMMGCDVYIVSGLTYYDYVTHVSLKGKNKGQIFGFPSFKRGACGFKRDSKIKALTSCDVGYFDYEDIAIAYDEVERQNQLDDHKRSILVQARFTERMAYDYCKALSFLSPIYSEDGRSRDGCALCPHGSELERESWLADWPDARPILVQLQDVVRSLRPEQSPLRGYKYFI